MRASITPFAIILTIAAVSANGSLRAAGDPQPQERAESRRGNGQRFSQMDRNGDGRISRSEWRGSDRSFRVHDWNNDGVLSGSELQQGWGSEREDDPDFDDLDPIPEWSPRNFENLDRNHDYRITPVEWPYDMDTFRRVDRNRDNAISRAEFVDSEFDDDRGDRFDYLDVDGNNRLTRDEWHASDDAFRWLDRNGDGVLTRREVVGEERDGRGDLFSRLDADRNNRISRNEWRWSRSSFDARDADHDGVLSRRELTGPRANDSSERATIEVGGTTRWVDTGVFVFAGDSVTFRATGTIQMSRDDGDTATPAGSRTGRHAPHAPLPDKPAGALLARVDQGPPVLIGDRTTPFQSPYTGRIYLSVNDDYLADNTGEFRVVVELVRTTR